MAVVMSTSGWVHPSRAARSISFTRATDPSTVMVRTVKARPEDCKQATIGPMIGSTGAAPVLVGTMMSDSRPGSAATAQVDVKRVLVVGAVHPRSFSLPAPAQAEG